MTLKINSFLFCRSYLYRYIMVKYFSKRVSDNKNKIEYSAFNMLKEIKSMANNNLVAIIFPYLKPQNTYTDFENDEYKNVINLMKTMDIEYLDLHKYFNSFTDDEIMSFRRSKIDMIHFNAKANKLKAEVIYNWLIGTIKVKEILAEN